MWRPSAEVNASNSLVTSNVNAFRGDRNKLSKDLVLFSLAYYIQTPEAQFWDTTRRDFVGALGGGFKFHANPGRTCKFLTTNEMTSKLTKAGNLFSSATLFGATVCMPPDSNFEIYPDSLSITNPFCQMSFSLEPYGAVDTQNPATGDAPILNGEPIYETRDIGLNVKTTFYALRSHHPEADKYHQWASALIGGARDWFERGLSK